MRPTSLLPSSPSRGLLACTLLACLAAPPVAAQPGTQPVNRVTQPNLREAAALVPPMNLSLLADSLEGRFQDRAAGYAIVVSYRDHEMQTRAGGVARRAPDTPVRAMSVDERYNLASVSKLITAAAVMHALNAQPRTRDAATLSSPMYRYLPQDWTFADGVDRITIRGLMSHFSGLRCETYSTFDELRTCLATPVADSARSTYQYLNSNFGYLRYVVARLAPARAGSQATSPAALASAYRGYVNQNVLGPSGVTGAECKPAATAPGLTYQFPHGNGQAGGAYADETLTCGASGWNLSARELAKFGRTLLYTDRILPPSALDQMRQGKLAIDHATLQGDVTRTGHGGYFPWDRNPGQTSTLFVGLSNGVSVAVIVTSQITAADATPNAGPPAAGFGAGVPLDATVYAVLASML